MPIMNYAIIQHSLESIEQDPIVFCDKSMTQALHELPKLIILILPKHQCNQIELVDWLYNWTTQFRDAGKELIIVAPEKTHYEFLEYSHPDLCLNYVKNIDDLSLPALNETEQVTDDTTCPEVKIEEPSSELELPFEPTVTSRPEQTSIDVLEANENKEETSPELYVYEPKVGDISSISGEFECKGCKVNRMWLKGDRFLTCENAECFNSSAGWKLTYELF